MDQLTQCESDLGASRSMPRREYSNKNMGAPPQRGFCDLARRNVHCLALSARNPTLEGEGGQTDISRRTIEQKLPIPVDCGAQVDI